jgi:two-component system response regulator LytT
MKIVLIEDEALTAEDLARTIREVDASIDIVCTLSSVKDAKEWFARNEVPDLVFSDIQLGDGISFEIFEHTPPGLPVVFCTAYDEYTFQAFKANGIDYILKPFTRASIGSAIRKFKEIRDNFSSRIQAYSTVMPLLKTLQGQKQGSLLVYQKDKILPVRLPDIALFYIENEVTYLLTFEKKIFSVNKTLEELEKMTQADYYRVNRQYLVNKKAIRDASRYFSRKLSLNLILPFPETVTVSKEKSGDFLKWLSEG